MRHCQKDRRSYSFGTNTFQEDLNGMPTEYSTLTKGRELQRSLFEGLSESAEEPDLLMWPDDRAFHNTRPQSHMEHQVSSTIMSISQCSADVSTGL